MFANVVWQRSKKRLAAQIVNRGVAVPSLAQQMATVVGAPMDRPPSSRPGMSQIEPRAETRVTETLVTETIEIQAPRMPETQVPQMGGSRYPPSPRSEAADVLYRSPRMQAVYAPEYQPVQMTRPTKTQSPGSRTVGYR